MRSRVVFCVLVLLVGCGGTTSGGDAGGPPDGGDASVTDASDPCAPLLDPDAGTCTCGSGTCAPYTSAWCNSGCQHM